MSTIAVSVHRVDASLDLAADVKRAAWLANLLDAKFSLFGFKFGLDPIVGLIPGIGDTLMLVAGAYPIYLVRKHGLGAEFERRMKINLAIDYFGGLLPLVGDLFDASYKANLKNLALLEKAVAKRAGR
jgi:hypothetical protein